MKEECIEEVTITVFPPMEGIGIIEEDPVETEEEACGDTTPSSLKVDASDEDTVVITFSSNDPMKRVAKAIGAAMEKYGDSLCVRRADYSTREGLDDSIEWLNSALRGSGDSTVLDEQKFTEMIGASAPIITINNRLSFVGTIPTIPQFLSRIGAALRMAQESRL